MLWKEIKMWAKDQGYKADRKKINNTENSYHYTWSKIDDHSVSGEATSVSKLATAIYNHRTNNAHIEYQTQYKIDQANKDISHEAEGW